MVKEYKHLSPEDVDFFMEHGYLIVKHAFSREQAAEFTKDMWTRLGLDPHDQSTWPTDRDRIHMPYHRQVPVATFAPRVWEIMKELLGGEDRIDAAASAWGDSFIVNLGPPPPAPAPVPPAELDNWHVDGDFFVHFLDSPEQALLVIPVFSDIAPGGGATFLAPKALDHVARYLAAHPEGVLPAKLAFVPIDAASAAEHQYPPAGDDDDPRAHPGSLSHPDTVRTHCPPTSFVELTASVGDVILLHPLMPHSASPNRLRPAPRVITNPPVALTAPFSFARSDTNTDADADADTDTDADTDADADRYSLVERKTLRALGVDRFEFAPTTPRRRLVPARVAVQAAMLEQEKRRLDQARATANARLSLDGEDPGLQPQPQPQAQTQTQPQPQPQTIAIAVT